MENENKKEVISSKPEPRPKRKFNGRKALEPWQRESIAELRKAGCTYNEIQEVTGCALMTIRKYVESTPRNTARNTSRKRKKKIVLAPPV
jgi:hypothetical protein